jgi:sugar/nucleoside kinase (ribokinase family)
LSIVPIRMSRDQRARDNWALLHTAELAAQKGAPVAVAFNLVSCSGLLMAMLSSRLAQCWVMRCSDTLHRPLC